MSIFRYFGFSFFLLFISSHAFSQERVSLNRHFYEIEPESGEKPHYTSLENLVGTGEKVLWVFDLKNRMVQQSKIGPSPDGNYQREIIEHFDTLNNKISQTVMNLDNSKSITAYYENGIKTAEVFRQDQNLFEIWKLENDTIYTSSHDEFKPSVDPENLNSFFAKKLTYPLIARRSGYQGTALVAVLVMKDGTVKEIELANSFHIHEILGEEALRVIKLFKGPYKPALDLAGNPVESWLYLPVRFKLS